MIAIESWKIRGGHGDDGEDDHAGTNTETVYDLIRIIGSNMGLEPGPTPIAAAAASSTVQPGPAIDVPSTANCPMVDGGISHGTSAHPTAPQPIPPVPNSALPLPPRPPQPAQDNLEFKIIFQQMLENQRSMMEMFHTMQTQTNAGVNGAASSAASVAEAASTAATAVAATAPIVRDPDSQPTQLSEVPAGIKHMLEKKRSRYEETLRRTLRTRRTVKTEQKRWMPMLRTGTAASTQREPHPLDAAIPAPI